MTPPTKLAAIDQVVAAPATGTMATHHDPAAAHRCDRRHRRTSSPAPCRRRSARTAIRAAAGSGKRRHRSAVKLAVVVQRYGQAINGGAELHARYIAEHLARHAEVEVLTTCATDYVTWRNELPAGVEQVNGVPVRRFPREARARSAACSASGPTACSTSAHSLGDELDWLDAEGPTSPALIDYIARHAGGLRLLPLLQLPLLPRVSRRAAPRPAARSSCRRPNATRRSGCRSSSRCSAACARVMYNSPEERAMIQAVAGNNEAARRRRRHRLGRADSTAAGRASGRSTTSADRSRSTSAGSTRTRAARSCSSSSRRYLQRSRRQAVARADRQLAARRPEASAHPPPRIPRRRRQVRRDGGGGAADHAVVLREPVDGGARGVGARPAGARQRPVRRAEGSVHPQQRRPLLRELRGVPRDARGDRAEPAG